jgi:hypothetical protein
MHEEPVQHCEHHHASGVNSKRSSVADGAELRSTTSGQLRAATEHSIMSIASGEHHMRCWVSIPQSAEAL